jgi:hypothetical protein
MKNTTNIGKAIKQTMEECGMTAVELAVAIHCSRSNIYDIFDRSSIATEQLQLISEILHHDFTAALYPQKKYLVVIEADEPLLHKLQDEGVAVKLVQRVVSENLGQDE